MDNEGEGKLAEDYKQWTKEKEQTIPQFNKEKVEVKPPDKKFLGLSKWVWFVAGAIVIFAILTVAIVLAAH
jgi:nitrate reductase NapE component